MVRRGHVEKGPRERWTNTLGRLVPILGQGDLPPKEGRHIKPAVLHACFAAQVFRNTGDDNTLFLVWMVAGFLLYAVGTGMSFLLKDIPNRFRPSDPFNPRHPDWRDLLRIQRPVSNGVGAIIGGLGIAQALGRASGYGAGTIPSQADAPLIGLGILIILSTALSSCFTRSDSGRKGSPSPALVSTQTRKTTRSRPGNPISTPRPQATRAAAAAEPPKAPSSQPDRTAGDRPEGKERRRVGEPKPSEAPPSVGPGTAPASSKGVDTLVELCTGMGILFPHQHVTRAVEELRDEGDSGSRALAVLMRDLLSCRSPKIIFALRVAGQVNPLPELVDSVRAVAAASELAEAPANARFPAEIVGDGRAGWTSGTYQQVVAAALKAEASLESYD